MSGTGHDFPIKLRANRVRAGRYVLICRAERPALKSFVQGWFRPGMNIPNAQRERVRIKRKPFFLIHAN